MGYPSEDAGHVERRPPEAHERLAAGPVPGPRLLPHRSETPGGGLFRGRRALASRRLGHGRQERGHAGVARHLVRSADVRARPGLGGGAAERLHRPRHGHHRFQHLYVWLLYGLFPLKWWFVDDLRELATGRIAGHQFPPARGRELLGALAGKALFVSWAFVLPAVLHPSWALLPLWGLAIFTLGNVLAAVFQLAHCVGEAEFLDSGRIESDWAEHQVATTVDFAPANALLGWYLGGLNFQVEHHLFPRVCHLHYPALARIVEETCRAHRVRYRCEPTLRSALAANWRWLRRMGSPAAA